MTILPNQVNKWHTGVDDTAITYTKKSLNIENWRESALGLDIMTDLRDSTISLLIFLKTLMRSFPEQICLESSDKIGILLGECMKNLIMLNFLQIFHKQQFSFIFTAEKGKKSSE